MAAAQPPPRGGAQTLGLRLLPQQHPVAPQRWWACPRCTLHNGLGSYTCAACAFQRPRPRPRHGGGTIPAEQLVRMAMRAAVAGMAGLALSRASSHQLGLQRLAATALGVAAVPLASALLGRLLGGGQPSAPAARRGTGPHRPADRAARRQQLRAAATAAVEQAVEAGAINEAELRLLAAVMQPAGSRAERVRMIAGVLELLRELEAGPGPQSRTTQLVSALVVYELNSLVDEMDYEELYAAFGGHPLPKGLAPAEVAALPALALTGEALATLHSPTCAVCLDSFQEGETARVLPACSHAFHSECLDPWLQSKAVCPVCRAQVEPPGKAAGEASGSAVGAAAASGSTAAATGSAAAEPLPSDDAA